jgi:diadenosine tetraphosphate (Ap4A) HIT family hydrolase
MDDLVPGCFNCDRQAAATLPPRDDLVRTSSWRVGHAFNVTLPGWLVLVPTRHVTSFAQLSPQACAELGVLTQQLSRALERVTGCVKTYLMQFSEAEGFSHLHVHLVPRLPDHPVHALGPEVFSLMTEDRREWLPEATRDSVALAVRAALDRAGTL